MRRLDGGDNAKKTNLIGALSYFLTVSLAHCVTVSQLFRLFVSDNRVTLAGGRFQSRSISNQDFTTTVINQLLLLKISGGFANGFAAHAQHIRQKLLRYFKVVCFHSVGGHQQPAGEPRFNWVKAVAYRRL